MFNLFNKGPKVRAGKQTQEEKKKPVVGMVGGKSARPANILGDAWKKLQKMDRKQAYTFGGIAVVALVALISIASMGGQDPEDFNDFETRGYDLANMPFSTDEAEQYLLASKYPDMNDKSNAGLYSKSEKEARQAEDAAEAQAKLDTSATSKGSEYRPNRYYGGGGGGASASPTQVGELNSAGLKSASGSGMKSTFGPQGDFSNFRSQEKGKDKFVPNGPGKGNARTALYQTAKASRAAAGLKNDKLLNAKKAMMGGNVKGSDAFLDDSGAVNLDKLAGLELDTNAPISSADLGGFDEALQDANDDGAQEDNEEEEMEWWEEMLIDAGKQIVNGLINWGMSAAQDAVKLAQAEETARELKWQEDTAGYNEYFTEVEKGKLEELKLAGEESFNQFLSSEGGVYDPKQGTITYTEHNDSFSETKTLNVTQNDDGSYLISKPTGEGANPADINLSKRDARKINEAQVIDVDNNMFGGAAQTSSNIAGLQAKAKLAGNATLGSNGNQRGKSDSMTVGGKTYKGSYSEDGSTFMEYATGTVYNCQNRQNCTKAK